jgi:hypothetical protein
MTNEQLYLLLSGQIFNIVTVLWMLNKGDKSINLRIDDMNKHFNQRFDDMNKRFDDLKDLIKSEIRRLEKKSILD